MKCKYCDNEIENIKSNGILVDVKSKSIKIYSNKIVYNYDDIPIVEKSKLQKKEKDTIIGIISNIYKNESDLHEIKFDFEKDYGTGYVKLLFCSIDCYNNFVKPK